MQVLLENTTFLLNKIVKIAGIIRGRALYEEIRYLKLEVKISSFKYFPDSYGKKKPNWFVFWGGESMAAAICC